MSNNDLDLGPEQMEARRVFVSTSYSESSILNIASTVDDEGLLERLDTMFVPSAWTTSLLRRVPGIGNRASVRLERRAGIAAKLQQQQSHLYLLGLLRSALWVRGLGSHQVNGVSNLLFDCAVAKGLPSSSVDVFVGQPYSSLASFQKATSAGMTTVLNHVNSDLHSENEVIIEEAAQLGIKPSTLWPDWIVDRVDREVSTVDYVLSPSAHVKRDLLKKGVPSTKIVHLPYGVDTDRFRPQSTPPSTAPLRIVFVGQVTIRKGLHYLDAALNTCLNIVDSCEAIGRVVDPELVPTLSNVTVRPFVQPQEIAERLQRASVFVFPSLAEGMARAVLEAMASGLPVITTVESGYEGIIEDGVNGFIVPARDSASIAAALDRLHSEPELASEIGAAARRTALNLDWNTFQKGFLEQLSRMK